MSETSKRRRGDRRDAVLLRETDALHFIMGIIYPHRADNEADQHRNEDPGHRFFEQLDESIPHVWFPPPAISRPISFSSAPAASISPTILPL